jgi:hypothetical protein
VSIAPGEELPGRTTRKELEMAPGSPIRGAHKNGEVVGPAGGETGVPRCLAEDQKLPKEQHQNNWDSKEHYPR